MKKGTILLLLSLSYTFGFCQDKHEQQIEIYTMPQLFTAQLSQDSLVPTRGRGKPRLGDESTFAVQYGRVFGKHTLLKAGIGFSTREYSMTKFNIDDFFAALFAWDSHPQGDPFPFAKVQYKLNYLELPLTIAREKGKPGKAVQLHYGMNIRLQFLTNAKATVTPDYSSSVVNHPDIIAAQKVYADDAKSFVMGVQPYGDVWFRIYKGLSLSLRTSLFSLYASPLNKRFSTSQGEFLASGISVAYRF